MATFTPEDVVAKYLATGIKPTTGMLGISCTAEGTYQAGEHGCCALGVMMVGRTCDPGPDKLETVDTAEQLDVKYLPFAYGFDTGREDAWHDSEDRPHPDTVLGARVRRAVEAALGPIK